MAFDFRKWVSDGLEERNAWQDTQVDAVVRMETPMRKQLMEMVKAVSECACEPAVTEAKEDDDEDTGDEPTDKWTPEEEAEEERRRAKWAKEHGEEPSRDPRSRTRKTDEAVTEAEEIEEDGATGAASVELPDAKRKRQLGKIKGKMSKKGVSKHPDMKAENLAEPKKKV